MHKSHRTKAKLRRMRARRAAFRAAEPSLRGYCLRFKWTYPGFVPKDPSAVTHGHTSLRPGVYERGDERIVVAPLKFVARFWHRTDPDEGRRRSLPASETDCLGYAVYRGWAAPTIPAALVERWRQRVALECAGSTQPLPAVDACAATLAYAGLRGWPTYELPAALATRWRLRGGCATGAAR